MGSNNSKSKTSSTPTTRKEQAPTKIEYKMAPIASTLAVGAGYVSMVDFGNV